MPQEILHQVNFNVGEIDPRAAARSDLKVYYAALELAENVVTSPLGQLVRRPGTEFIDFARHVLVPVAYAADHVSAPEGGTPGAIVAADGTPLLTTVAMGAAAMVLLQIDFGAPVTIHCLDLIDYGVQEPAGGGGGPVVLPVPSPFTYPFPNANFVAEIGGVFQEP